MASCPPETLYAAIVLGQNPATVPTGLVACQGRFGGDTALESQPVANLISGQSILFVIEDYALSAWVFEVLPAESQDVVPLALPTGRWRLIGGLHS